MTLILVAVGLNYRTISTISTERGLILTVGQYFCLFMGCLPQFEQVPLVLPARSRKLTIVVPKVRVGATFHLVRVPSK